ncbi:MAG: NAD(P) transhydrogenase subunit alpha [Propionibacteriaceae bacterium]
MRIAVVAEDLAGEARVAAVPETVAVLTRAGHQVQVAPNAGRRALITDQQYRDAGATIGDAVAEAGLVLSVQPLSEPFRDRLLPGTATLSFFATGQRLDDVRVRRDVGLTTFAMELVPRISRAQSMDALTSQAMVAGYRAAIVTAGRLRKFFGLSMTAAGTVPPAQVVVLGAGVAGLQAIATCRRLGAVVKGYDVRAAAAEEIRSVGAVAIDLQLDSLEGAGGYAREMTVERAALQAERLTPYVAAADALITTAAVPGRTAPVLVSRAMVEAMTPGSVVVDLAADSGGNVEGSRPGEVVQIGSAQVWGGSDVPSQMPGPASRLYAQNVLNLVTLLTPGGRWAPDFGDEIVAGTCVTHDGVITHAPTAALVEGGER